MHRSQSLRVTSLVAAGLLSVSSVVLAAGEAASRWDIDGSHVTAQFSVRHMMISTVRGQFDKVAGVVMLDEQNPAKSEISVTIETASINTREGKRDEHLRGPDFFDAQKHPQITFKSTTISKLGQGKFKVTGDLTMRGATKPLTLTASLTDKVKSPWGKMVRGVSATGKLSRKDWGLTWNKALEAGGFAVSDEVELQIDAELIAP